MMSKNNIGLVIIGDVPGIALDAVIMNLGVPGIIIVEPPERASEPFIELRPLDFSCSKPVPKPNPVPPWITRRRRRK